MYLNLITIMKFLALLFFGVLFWIQSAVALPVPAEVFFFSKHGESFQVVLNGRLLNRHTTARLQLHDIPAGYHMVEIRFPDRYGVLVHRARIYIAPGYNTEYMLQVAGHRPKVILNKVAQYPLRNRRYYPPASRNQDSYPDRDRYDESGRYDERDRGDYRDNDYQNNDNYNRNQVYRDQNPAVMQPSEVDRLLNILKDRPFDDDKLTLARQALGNSTFYAEDLKRVLDQFTYDSKKLELAKQLYRNVYDPHNFYVVYDSFRFDSDRRELERYVDSLSR